jgi:hypothetical protein
MTAKLLPFILLTCINAIDWNIDDRCLRRRQITSKEDVTEVENLESSIGPEQDEHKFRHLTERELESKYRFHLRLHWEEGYCWQEEWQERFWCAECERGTKCNEGDSLELHTCKGSHLQRFTWLPTKGGGRLKVGNKNLCLQRVSTNEFELRVCSTSLDQVLVGFNPKMPFELYPLGYEGVKCLTEDHHPKPFETLFTRPCDVARKVDTSLWEAYWPRGKYDPTIPSLSENKQLTNRENDCTPSNPCPECWGDCATDEDCEGNLKCYVRGRSNPWDAIPGCEGAGTERWDYCYNPNPTPSPTSSPTKKGMNNNNSTALIPLQFPAVRCTPEKPCGECQGDCKIDLDCKDDLVCFQKDGDVSVPGCTGRDASRTDWCVRPKNLKR